MVYRAKIRKTVQRRLRSWWRRGRFYSHISVRAISQHGKATLPQNAQKRAGTSHSRLLLCCCSLSLGWWNDIWIEILVLWNSKLEQKSLEEKYVAQAKRTLSHGISLKCLI